MHVIDSISLSREQIDGILDLAIDIIEHREQYSEACRGKKLATLFYEPSTRTRLSFTSAMMELGGNVLGFSDAGNTSVSKGETVADTTRVINCFADIIAMRHYLEGAPYVAALNSDIPVINAGDGSHTHPTQTLTDMLTIRREIGRLDNITIGFCGDLRYGRTVHSLLKALSRYPGLRVKLISPEQLALPQHLIDEVCIPAGIEVEECKTIQEYVADLDVLYMTRVQKERFDDEEEYNRLKDSFILTNDKLVGARPEMRILHPLPRVNEIAVEVDDDPRAAYFRQVENGKFVRMALILSLLRMTGALSGKNAAVADDNLMAGGVSEHPELRCDNPKCICNHENVRKLFRPDTAHAGLYRCAYCEHTAVKP